MIGEFATSLAFYMSFGFEWIFPFFVMASSILILNYVKALDMRVRIFIATLVAWYTIQVLMVAIDTGLKNDNIYQGCIYTASTLNDDLTDEPEPKPSSEEPILMSNSSQEQTDENNPPTDSTSPPVSMDAPIATSESGETSLPRITRSLSF
jgi:hypothetical protein